MVKIISLSKNGSTDYFYVQKNEFMKLLKSIILLLVIPAITFSQADSTRSQAFKDTQFHHQRYFKAKYPSYSLLAGYILVTEANRGDPFAQHELGLRYLIGQGFSPDTVKAVYWIRKAVDQNLPAARFNYGIMLYNGIGVPWNPFDAYVNFKNAALAGLPEAEFAYGLVMTDNLTINRNYTEAYKWFKRSAKGGYQPAKEALEQMQKSGFIPPATSDSASTVVRRDENAKIINPQWDLDFYNFNNGGKDSNNVNQIDKVLSSNSTDLIKFFGLDENKKPVQLPDTSGMGILNFAADNGSPEAIYLVAKCYETGTHFKKNLVKAAAQYLRAYRLGSYKAGQSLYKLIQQENFVASLKDMAGKKDADAMYVFAGITALGFTNLITEPQALDLLKNAVTKKHIPSMIELGLCYSSGTLVKKDLIEARSYWEMAKKLGSNEAEIRIAFTDAVDSTNTYNKSKAVQTLIDGAENGSVLSQTFLAYCYEKGIGVKENKGKAVQLYRRAAQRGNEAAFNSLKRLYDDIRPPGEEFKIYQPQNF